jgi:hypothetical protein
MMFQGVDHLLGQAGDVNIARVAQTGEDVLDDRGWNARVDEIPDLGGPLDGMRIVVPVAVR